MTSTLHRRQFLLGPARLSVRDDWESVEISDGVHLSHCPTLPVVQSGKWTLLGIAVQSDSDRPAPEVELEGATDADFLSETWAGRWILIGDGRVRQDVSGTLACFYRPIEDALWISSSPGVLRELEPVLQLPEAIRHAQGMDWFPPPHTGIEGVHRLLPTQSLTLEGELVARPLVRELPDLSYNELLDRIETRLRTEIANLARLYDVWLPLSGGGDSRLILAAQLAEDVKPTAAFTFVLPDLPYADRELPPQIAAKVGVRHHLIEPEPLDSELLDLWDRHTARQSADLARESFAARQWEHVGGTLELGGGIIFMGKASYRNLPATLGPSPEATAADILSAFPNASRDAVLAYAEWVHASDLGPVEWRDRFFLEQRTAGWMGAIGLGLDLNRVARVHPGNSEDYIAASLALPPDVRDTWLHYDHLFKRLAPELGAFPFNPPGSLRHRIRARVDRELEEYQYEGGVRRYVAARSRRLRARRSVRRMD